MSPFAAGVVGVLVAAAGTAVATTALTAPYGRHARAGFGPVVGPRLGWVLMEAPAVLVTGAVFLAGSHRDDLAPRVLLGLWMAHYVHRAFVYPLRMRSVAGVPVLVVALGAAFNTVNGALNAWWLAEVGPRDAAWLVHPGFVVGALGFVAGYVLNRHADAVLRALRAPGETTYRIPVGGAYRWVSCPNYLGELLMWLGFALAAASPAAAAFVVYTLANLGPRAAAHHRWYQATFPDYPPERRALVPFLW